MPTENPRGLDGPAGSSVERTSPTASRWLAATAALLILAAPVWAQGQKKDQNALVLLLFPLLSLGFLASLQVAVLLVFPAFSRRCATAVRRFRGGSLLTGLATAIVLILLTALVSGVTRSQPAGGVFLVLGAVLAAVGGVGVSLEIGKWGIARLQSDTPAHPVVEVFCGVCLVSWATIIPVVGLVGWLLASVAALGAGVMAVFRGRALDEALPPVAVPPPAPAASAPAESGPPAPAPPAERRPPAGAEQDSAF